MRAAKVRIDTWRYQWSHGRPPSGYGVWVFQLGPDEETPEQFWLSGAYGTCLQEAIRAAREQGCGVVVLLP